MFFSRFVGTIQRSSIEPLTFPRYLPPRFLPLYYSNKHLRRAAATVSRCEATRESLPPIFPVSVQITIHPNFLRSRAFIRSCAILAELETSDTLEITRLWPRARGDQLNSKPVIACYIVPLPLDRQRFVMNFDVHENAAVLIHRAPSFVDGLMTKEKRGELNCVRG